MSAKREHPDGARRGGAQAPPGKGRTKHAGPEEALCESERPVGLRSAGEFQRLKEFSESIAETMGEAVLLIDPDGKITFANPRVQVLLGYAPEELTGRHWATIVPADQYPILEDADARRASGEPVGPYDLELVHHEDHRVFVNVSATPRQDPVTGRFAGMRAVMTDITERRQVEKLLRIQRDLAIALSSTTNLRAALELVLTAAMQNEGIDCGGIYLVDEATCGLDLAVHRGFSARFLETESHYPADAPNARFVAEGTPTYWPSPPHEYSNDVLKREGIRAVASIPIRSGDRILAALNVASHVRDDFPMPTRHALEAIGAQIGGVIVRARAVEAVRKSEERFRAIANYTYDWESWVGPDGRPLWINPTVERMTGYTVEECLAMPDYPLPLIHDEDREAVAVAFRQAVAGVRINDLVLRVRRKDGTVLWASVLAQGIYDDRGVVLGHRSSIRDISDRKRMEDARETAVELLRLSNAGGDLPKLAQDLTAWFQRITGCEAVGIRLREGDEFPYYETRGFPPEFVLAENRLCAVDAAGEVVRDNVGNPVLACMCGNILRGRFDPTKPFFTPHGSFWTNSTTELLASTTEADRQARTRNRCNGEGYESVALLPLRTQGETIGLLQLNDKRSGRFTLERIQFLEELADYVGIALAHRRATETVCTSERKLSNAMKIARLGYWEFDVARNLFTFDDHFYAIFGTSAERVGGYTMSPDRYVELFLHPEDAGMVAREIQIALTTTDPHFSGHVEHRIKYANGETGYIAVRYFVVKDEQGHTIKTCGANQDITERKLAEEALRQEHERLALAQCAGQVGVFDWDPRSDRRIWTPQLDALYGMEPGSVEHTSEDWARRVHPDDLAEAQAAVQQCFRERRPELENDYRIVRPDGEVRWLANRARVTYDAAGKPVRIVGACADITERKRTESEIRSLARFPDENPNPILRIADSGIVLYANKAAEPLLQSLDGAVGSPAPAPWRDWVTQAVADQATRALDAEHDGRVYAFHVTPIREGGYVNLYGRDVTERKRAEEALREREEQFRQVVENISEVLWLTDWRERKLLYVSPSYETVYGRSRQSLFEDRRSWIKAIHPEDRARVDRVFAEKGERGEYTEEEYRIVRPDGDVRWVRGRSFAIRDASGQVYRWVGVAEDITVRKLAEESLQASKARFRRVVEHISDALIVDDGAGRVVFANDRFLALFGFDRKDLAALVLEDYVAPEHRKELRERHDRRIRGEPVPTHFEYEGIRRDGGRLWLEVDVAPLVDAAGRTTGTQSTIRDITERKRAEAALRETQQRLEAILEVTKTGVDVIDHEFNLHYVNPSWQKVYGDPTGRKCYEYFMERDRPCPTCGIPKALETRQIQVTEETLPRENNRVIEVHTIPFQDASGQWLVSELNVDITERKRVEEALRASEERFRATFEQAAVGIAHVTPEGRFLRVNQGYADIVGYTPEELRQRTFQDVTHPEDLAADVAAARQLFAGKIGTYSLEKRYVRKNGAVVWGSLTASAARDAQGRCEYLIGVVQDITARKEAEAARVQAEQRFTQVLENVSAVAVILSSDECITYCNPYVLELTGWSDAEVRGRNWFDVFIPADEHDRVRAVFAAAVYEDRLAPHFENDILTRDGRQRLISWSNTALYDAVGRVIGLASLGYDITDRRRAAEAVGIERAKLRSILEAMDDAVCIIDQQHQIVYANPAFVQQFGLVEGRPCYEYFHGRSDACAWCRNAEVFAGKSLRWELSYERNGRAYDVFETALRNEGGTPSKLDFYHDVTARREAEAALASRTRELETVMESTPDAIARLDHELRHVFVNRRWVELTGLSPEAAQGRTPGELRAYGESCVRLEETLRQVLAKRRMSEVEFAARTALGERRLQVRVVPEPAGREGTETSTVLTITRDVTEERRLQEELNQAQKMEVVGQLATGIAHDINNVLTAISGYAALARAELPPGHQTGQSLDQVEEAVLQAAGVVRGLLTFSHKMPINRQTVELRNVLVGAAQFVKRLLPAAIEVVLEGADGTPLWVSADGTQLQQVILNLAVNARDAMPDGGTLRFALRADEAGDGSAERPGRSQRFVRLVVSDTGQGIPAEVLPHLFEPFFTTKPLGQGTGLGLATIKSVVEQHGGDVQVHSIPGCDAQFTISLPCAEPPSAVEPERTEATRARARGELILVADDNVQVLDVISAGLRQIGYDVLPVTDAPAIHTECARYGNRVKLAILDVDLPGGSGVDALRAIRQGRCGPRCRR